MKRLTRSCLTLYAVFVLVVSACATAQADRLHNMIAGDTGLANPVELQRIELMYQGATRSFFIHVPPNPGDGAPVAAVFVFHGGMGDGVKAEGVTRMMPKADRFGFVAVYPNGGRNGTEQWNDGRDTTKSDKNDVGFVVAIIDRLIKDFNVDPRRIFATGASNGGMFVYRLACEVSGRFAAFAAVIANLPADFAPHCVPSRPVPMMLINGTNDPLMPWSGGEIKSLRRLGIGAGGSVISATQTVDFWVHADGCTPEPAVTMLPDRFDDGTSVVRYKYSPCKGDAQVVLYEIRGGGHGWPGNVSSSRGRFGLTSDEIDATQVIVEFFRNHGL